MKIAIITSGFFPVIDGVTVSGFVRVKKLSEWGYQVLVFCPDYSSLAHIYPNWQQYTGEILPGVKVFNLKSTPFFVEFERNVALGSYREVIKQLEGFKPDIIHVDEPERLFMGFLRIPGVKFAQKNNIPCVGFFRTNFLDYAEDFLPLPQFLLGIVKSIFQSMVKKIYNSYDFTLVTSIITDKKLVAMGIKNSKYENLVGFDSDRYQPNLIQPDFWQQKFGITDIENKVKLIFVGRLTPDKGWNFTIKAFQNLAKIYDINQLALIIVGDGELKPIITKKFKAISNYVYCLGRIAPEIIPALYLNSDIHVTTSEKETRGLTILEAFAAGIPVIAPRAGGVVQNIQDGVNGFLYQPQNIEDFQTKLLTLVQDQNLRISMGKRGKSQMDQYDWNITVKNLIAIWDELISLKSSTKNLTSNL